MNLLKTKSENFTDMSLFEKHKGFLDEAIKALHDRSFYAAYPEFPSKEIYGENADPDGQDFFKSQIGKKFEELSHEGSIGWVGTEESPYLGNALNISYPQWSKDQLIEKAKQSFRSWSKISPEDRAGVLIDSLERMKARFFDIAYATMHTTGQGYMMAFQASGPHGADRAMEAIAGGYEELKRFPSSALWKKPMGKYDLELEKSWVPQPKGISLIIGCSTFPTWNSTPGLYASLITGNPVIVKPHPKAILPMAIVVAEIQNALEGAGLSRDICQLAIDTVEAPITKELAEDPAIKLIDYTGGPGFGDYVESLPGKQTFTEKTGVNSVMIHSTDKIEKVIQNLGFSVALYSGQMCTAPQNIFIPKNGIETENGIMSAKEFADKLGESIDALVKNPKAGPFVLGAIQNSATSERVTGFNEGEVVLADEVVENPMFKNARTLSPKVAFLNKSEEQVYSSEIFGPLVLVIETEDFNEALEKAGELAMNHGAISCGAYTLDNDLKETIKDRMAESFTPVSFNLVGNIYLNQHAAFSDFHVTGGNPAGNASFTNPEFVIKRFVWVGFREPKN